MVIFTALWANTQTQTFNSAQLKMFYSLKCFVDIYNFFLISPNLTCQSREQNTEVIIWIKEFAVGTWHYYLVDSFEGIIPKKFKHFANLNMDLIFHICGL